MVDNAGCPRHRVCAWVLGSCVALEKATFELIKLGLAAQQFSS